MFRLEYDLYDFWINITLKYTTFNYEAATKLKLAIRFLAYLY